MYGSCGSEQETVFVVLEYPPDLHSPLILSLSSPLSAHRRVDLRTRRH